MADRRQEEDDYRFCRTTCGLVGFIVFFIGALISFISAEETGNYYEYTIIFGFVMLFVTSMFFCCVLQESKRISNMPTRESEMPLNPIQPEQPNEPEESAMPELHWGDQSRCDMKYVRSVLRVPPGDSDETMDSESETDRALREFNEMVEFGLQESEAGTSIESGDNNSTKCESGATGVQLDSAEAGPSKVAGKTSDIIESEGDTLASMSAFSLSDSSGSNVASGQKKDSEGVSAALSKLSLDDSENLAAEFTKLDPSSAHSEEKSNEDLAHAKDSKESIAGKSPVMKSKKED